MINTFETFNGCFLMNKIMTIILYVIDGSTINFLSRAFLILELILFEQPLQFLLKNFVTSKMERVN